VTLPTGFRNENGIIWGTRQNGLLEIKLGAANHTEQIETIARLVNDA
jgi:enoyl-CoA hydratase/carnithine racemase